ncbi:MAG: hypothetical protein GY953_03035, partial [bacterium]|nr:hypothetical protein [bacterium]
MQQYRVAVIILWLAGSIAAFIYSRQKGFPIEVALPVAAAMLVELTLYLGLAFEEVRNRCEALGSRLAGWLVASAVVPYLLYTLSPAPFEWPAFGALVALSAAVSFWYVVLPHRRIVDVVFLILMAGVYL